MEFISSVSLAVNKVQFILTASAEQKLSKQNGMTDCLMKFSYHNVCERLLADMITWGWWLGWEFTIAHLKKILDGNARKKNENYLGKRYRIHLFAAAISLCCSCSYQLIACYSLDYPEQHITVITLTVQCCSSTNIQHKEPSKSHFYLFMMPMTKL